MSSVQIATIIDIEPGKVTVQILVDGQPQRPLVLAPALLLPMKQAFERAAEEYQQRVGALPETQILSSQFHPYNENGKPD